MSDTHAPLLDDDAGAVEAGTTALTNAATTVTQTLGADAADAVSDVVVGSRQIDSACRRSDQVAGAAGRRYLSPEAMATALIAAGWTRVKATLWRSPGGLYFRGPAGAYRKMVGAT
jgi:hypothetical protein